jgi:hypothetical protein
MVRALAAYLVAAAVIAASWVLVGLLARILWLLIVFGWKIVP